MNSATVPFDWLKSVSSDLLKMDEVPLLGSPQFSWEQFSLVLSKVFEIKDFKVEPGESQWRLKDNLFEGFANPTVLSFSMAPLSGTFFWLMNLADIPYIFTSLLTKKESYDGQFIDNEFQEGFLHFLTAQIIDSFQQIFLDKTLSTHLRNEKSVPDENAFCLDIKISLLGKTLWGRLILSEEFRHAWKRHFTQEKMHTTLPSHLAEEILMPIHLEAGSVSLTANDYLHIHPGDFLILDSCSIEPKKGGKVVMVVNGQTLFYAKVKEGNLEILEKPLYKEGDDEMSNNDFENEDFLKQQEHEKNSHENEEDSFGDFEESDFEEDEFEQEEDELGEEFEEEPTLEELLKKPEKKNEELQKEEPEEKTEELAVEKEKKQALTAEEIPVTLKIELGQLKLSIGQLLNLQPGNLLELDIPLEDNVDLVVNGKRIGKGELLRLGETLGVRIVDLL